MTTRLTRWLTTLDNFEANGAVAYGTSLRAINPRYRAGAGETTGLRNCRSAQPVSLNARTALKRTK